MSSSFSISGSRSFTLTDAKHMAAKVATDLKRMNRLYGYPADADIPAFEAEVTQLLKAGYLGTVTYGFLRDGNWIEPTLRYTAHDLEFGANDDDPGRVPANKNVDNATFHSYLTYCSAWNALTAEQQLEYKRTSAVQRTGSAAPGVSGYFADDKTYSSGNRSLNRASVRSYQ